MAEGWSAAAANSALDALAAAYPWIKLHVGAPGSAGTSNPATETTRKQASWNSASAGSVSNSATLSWPNVAGTEDYTHFSAWSASSAGNFGFSGTVVANAVTAGDTFQATADSLTASVTVAT